MFRLINAAVLYERRVHNGDEESNPACRRGDDRPSAVAFDGGQQAETQ